MLQRFSIKVAVDEFLNQGSPIALNSLVDSDTYLITLHLYAIKCLLSFKQRKLLGVSGFTLKKINDGHNRLFAACDEHWAIALVLNSGSCDTTGYRITHENFYNFSVLDGYKSKHTF